MAGVSIKRCDSLTLETRSSSAFLIHERSVSSCSLGSSDSAAAATSGLSAACETSADSMLTRRLPL